MNIKELFKNPPFVLDIDNDLEPIKEPSKKWRNKYISSSDGPGYTQHGHFVGRGKVYWGFVDHPSKELALESVVKYIERHPHWTGKHLGAFTVEE